MALASRTKSQNLRCGTRPLRLEAQRHVLMYNCIPLSFILRNCKIVFFKAILVSPSIPERNTTSNRQSSILSSSIYCSRFRPQSMRPLPLCDCVSDALLTVLKKNCHKPMKRHASSVTHVPTSHTSLLRGRIYCLQEPAAAVQLQGPFLVDGLAPPPAHRNVIMIAAGTGINPSTQSTTYRGVFFLVSCCGCFTAVADLLAVGLLRFFCGQLVMIV